MADLFESNTETPAQEAPTQQAQSLFQIGDRQYDAESAKTKIENADNHIQRIEQENARMRQEMEQLKAKASQAATVEDALAALQQQQPQQPTQQAPSAEPQQLDTEALLAQAREAAQQSANEAYAKARMQAVHEANFEASLTHAKAQFGDDYATKLAEMGTQLGMNQQAINELATTNPAVFKKVFQAPQVQQSATPEGQTAYSRPTPNSEIDSVVEGLFMTERFGGTEKAKAWMEAEKQVSALLKKNN